MSWFCNSKEAIEHKKNCEKDPWNCGKCIWIDESSSAMAKYGKPEKDKPHPLLEEILKTFNGRIINE